MWNNPRNNRGGRLRGTLPAGYELLPTPLILHALYFLFEDFRELQWF
ncbi:hypothetical protein MHL86_06165 [Brevibacillus laterosporus]|nr:hypothetical protein [Brevibacillus laterosporus]